MMNARRFGILFALAVLLGLLLTVWAPGPMAPVRVARAAEPAFQGQPPAADKVPKVIVVAPTASYDPRRWESTLLMTNSWRALGIDVDLRGFSDFGALNTKIISAPWDWDAFVSGFVSRPARLDPDEMIYRPWNCAGIADQGPNTSGICDPELDKVIIAQRQTLDPKKRQELVWKAQEILAKQIPEITFFHIREVFAYNKDRFDNWQTTVGRGMWNLNTLLKLTPKTNDKILRVAWAQDLPTINPLALDQAVETLQYTYDTLARIGDDGTPTPWAAESWKAVDDTTVDVTLRQGMKFHDGTPVTVDDVKFSFDFIKKYGTAGFFPGALDPIKSVEVKDDRTIRFTLKAPFAPLYFVTFTTVYILPKHIWENIAQKEGLDSPAKWANPNPVGSGPFKLTSFRRGEEIRLEAFKEHFNAPKIDGALIIHYANTDAVFAAIATGKADLPDRSLTELNIAAAKKVPFLGMSDSRDFGVYYMSFNFRRPPFNHLAFRQAIAHTLDYDTVVNGVLGGYGEPGQGMIAPVLDFWHNPQWDTWLKQDYSFDLVKAKQILADAGYRWDAQGKLYYPAGGPPVKPAAK